MVFFVVVVVLFCCCCRCCFLQCVKKFMFGLFAWKKSNPIQSNQRFMPLFLTGHGASVVFSVCYICPLFLLHLVLGPLHHCLQRMIYSSHGDGCLLGAPTFLSIPLFHVHFVLQLVMSCWSSFFFLNQ